jgi:hypothetical protein
LVFPNSQYRVRDNSELTVLALYEFPNCRIRFWYSGKEVEAKFGTFKFSQNPLSVKQHNEFVLLEEQNYSLKGSDEDVEHSELLGFWNLSIVRYSKENTK